MRTLLTPEFTAEVEAIWQVTQRANREYRAHPNLLACPWDKCDDGTLCRRCRVKVERDLTVATSVTECADLLALLNLPRPARQRIATKPCGTPAAWRRHRRNGEDPCQPCRDAVSAEWKVANDKRRRSQR